MKTKRKLYCFLQPAQYEKEGYSLYWTESNLTGQKVYGTDIPYYKIAELEVEFDLPDGKDMSAVLVELYQAQIQGIRAEAEVKAKQVQTIISKLQALEAPK